MTGTHEALEITDPVLLIRINRLFHPGMSSEALYEATRGIWRLGARREGARYALAVYDGIVREAYEIESWHPAGSTPYQTRDAIELAESGDRWEFVGQLAPEPVRERYVGQSVAHYFQRGEQSPVKYVAC